MMNRTEWINARKKGIGGSDAGAIVGLSKYKTAFDVYADKLSLVPENEDTEAMRQGRDLEEYVARRFIEQTGLKVRKSKDFIKNQKYPFAFANVDRLIIGQRAGLECKTANTLTLKRYKNGEYPEEYYCQCMHYMAVTGYDKWYLAVLILGKGFEIFTIERDEEEIEALMKAEKTFWENNVLKQIPPLPSGTEQNSSSINNIYPVANGETIKLLPSADNLLKRRAELCDFIKQAETEKTQIEQEIKLMLGNNEKAENDTYRVTWKNFERTTFNYQKFFEENTNIDVSDYMETNNYRRLTIKEAN